MLALVMVMQLTACGGKKVTAEDAKTYVEALLSVTCTGKNTTDVKFDDLEEEEYESTRAESIQDIMDSMDLDSMNMSEDIAAGFAEFIDAAMKSASYEVGDAKEVDGGFDVPVTIHPLNIFSGVNMEDIQNKAIEMYTNGELDISDESALYGAIFTMMLDSLNGSLDNPEYTEDYEMTIHVSVNDKQQMSGDEDDANEFGEHIFSVEF